MNMNQQQVDKLAQAVAGIVGIVALVYLVVRGWATTSQILPLVAGILSGLGFLEAGRRQGKRTDLDDAVVDLIRTVMHEALDSSQAQTQTQTQTQTRPPTTGEAMSASVPDDTTLNTDTDDGDGDTGTDAGDGDETPPAGTASERVAGADYQTLRRVAGQIDGLNGNQSAEVLSKRLSNTDPHEVLAAFDALESDS